VIFFAYGRTYRSFTFNLVALVHLCTRPKTLHERARPDPPPGGCSKKCPTLSYASFIPPTPTLSSLPIHFLPWKADLTNSPTICPPSGLLVEPSHRVHTFLFFSFCCSLLPLFLKIACPPKDLAPPKDECVSTYPRILDFLPFGTTPSHLFEGSGKKSALSDPHIFYFEFRYLFHPPLSFPSIVSRRIATRLEGRSHVALSPHPPQLYHVNV